MHSKTTRKKGGTRFITTPARKKKPLARWLKFLAEWDFVLIALVILLTILALRAWVFLYAHVPTGSMVPTIPVGSYMLADRNAYRSEDICRGDIVIFHSEKTGLEDSLVKRVIGLPGETVTLSDGCVYIDGELLDESDYVNGKTMPMNGRAEFNVPEGHYLMLGDNRTNSMDSRSWADPYISEDEIKGRVFVIFNMKQKYYYWVG